MKKAPETNLRVLRPSREKRIPGDVFAYQMPDGLFRFGRLIARATGVGYFKPDDCQHLVYFFRGESPTRDGIPSLLPLNLLIPPLVVNQKPWTLGYFERVARIAIRPDEVFSEHYFFDSLRKRFCDLRGIPVADPGRPCAYLGLNSYRTVDDELSLALGFSLVESSDRM